MKEPELGVEIRRNAEVKLLPFTDHFVGFEKLAAVRSLFGVKTAQVLKDLKVEFFSLRFGYMSVSDEDGHILISTNHLKNADLRVLYLDVIHELFHVKQFMEGKNLFQNEFEYVDSPMMPEFAKTATTPRDAVNSIITVRTTTITVATER